MSQSFTLKKYIINAKFYFCLQIDLGTLAMIKRLDTQGRHGVSEWVSSFTLSYSSVESNFKFYAQVYVENNSSYLSSFFNL